MTNITEEDEGIKCFDIGQTVTNCDVLYRVLISLRKNNGVFFFMKKNSLNDEIFELVIPLLSTWSLLDKKLFMENGRGLIITNGIFLKCIFRYGNLHQFKQDFTLNIDIDNI